MTVGDMDVDDKPPRMDSRRVMNNLAANSKANDSLNEAKNVTDSQQL
jgi:hypothetical protein